ncbi:hypothetical protein [Bifidobacterium thermophilum]|uniref:Uncharacterized protein n=1 Tax=Bifidobacterium thermophilum TaxID=33905 RepID=A0A7X9NSL2_9BIFI|nr:hypothetical protein [Bifidobacterium thermophilum]NME61917.1 hypothetical protein [Bifidobacterium thermophilum]
MHSADIADIRLTRAETDGDVTFDFTTADGRPAGFSRTASGFVRFDGPTGDIYLDFTGQVKLLFAAWSHRLYFSESSMLELSDERIDPAERDRLQLGALNDRLAEEDTGLHIDTWDHQTGVFTATVA